MGGYVAKKLGDGLMALFGYPVAQENDAERAARAALSIQRSLYRDQRAHRHQNRPGRGRCGRRDAVETTKERWWEPEVHRTAGEIASEVARRRMRQKRKRISTALSQSPAGSKPKSWELRASMSLGRLWRDQGKVPEARELLAPVYGWFTEGFGTRDLKEAKALLGKHAVRTAAALCRRLDLGRCPAGRSFSSAMICSRHSMRSR